MFVLAVSGRILAGPHLFRSESSPVVHSGSSIHPLVGEVEAGDCPSESRRRQLESDSEPSGGGGEAAEEGRQAKRWRGSSRVSQKILEERIEKFFKQHPTTPLAAICKSQQWLADQDLRYVRDNNPKFQCVMDVLANELIPFSIRQFTDLYRNARCKPLFAMPRGINETVFSVEENGVSVDKSFPYYLSAADSLSILTELLEFQCDGNVKDFLTDLVDVLDKRIPKLNSFFVYGPPSSGKNFFFDCVLNFFLIRGQMMNIRKGEGFPYMDCVDRRVIMFNEPNICESPSTMDTLKMLFGGDFCPAAVKFKAPTVINRTPVFILTNDPFLFKNVPAFEDRMKRFTWKFAPFLKSIKGYPNPIVFPDLLEKYNISY